MLRDVLARHLVPEQLEVRPFARAGTGAGCGGGGEVDLHHLPGQPSAERLGVDHPQRADPAVGGAVPALGGEPVGVTR